LGEKKNKRKSKRESVVIKSKESKENSIYFNEVDGGKVF
jgi:hypothetical protein